MHLSFKCSSTANQDRVGFASAEPGHFTVPPRAGVTTVDSRASFSRATPSPVLATSSCVYMYNFTFRWFSVVRVRCQKSIVTCPQCLLYWTVLYRTFPSLQKELCTLKLLHPPLPHALASNCPCAVIVGANVIWKSFFLYHIVSFILNHCLLSHSNLLPSVKR